MNFQKKNFKKLKGDASTRIFFRNTKKKSSSIIVYANKDKRSNLLIYDSINKILLKNNILAPKLLSENYSKNYIEIEDFGNKTIFTLLRKNGINKLIILKKIIRLLGKLQSIQQREVKDFKKKNYKIPYYYPKILLEEAKLFSKWYIDQYLVRSQRLIFKKKFIKIVKNLIKKLHYKNVTFVHRDFHVSNLMMVKNKIAVIDTQDALIGNKAYDLASLIDDVRIKTSKNTKKKLFEYYLKSQKKINKLHITNDFEIISVLRNLKIIGIFKRLAVRDKKKKYLKLIPNAWNLIELRSRNNNKFKNLNDLLDTIKKIK
ncbi:phosphotransferase [Candidatus Pelagibacter sp.]|nr:phosphotransferase [Candidatus Pelagibacter sp.]